MKSLNKAQIKYLKQLAHNKNVSVMIGHNGLSDSIYKEIDIQLNAHELIKIKLPAGEKSSKETALSEICEHCQCHLVTLIGRIGIVYRAAKKPEIKLP